MIRRSVILLVTTLVIIIGWFTATMVSDNRPVLGLDLQGGVSIALEPVPGSDLSGLDTATAIIRNRVDALGIAEPEVSRQGNTIIVDLPGVKDRARAEELVGRTAELRFRESLGSIPYSSAEAAPPASSTTVDPNASSSTTIKGASTTVPASTPSTTSAASVSPNTTGKSAGVAAVDPELISAVRPAQTGSTTTPSTNAGPTTTVKGGKATTTTTVPPSDGTCQDGKIATPTAQDTAENPQVILPDKPSGKDKKHLACYVLGPTIMTGKNVGSADAVIDTATSQWQVNVHFKNNEFVDKIGTVMVGKNVAIVLDGEVQSAPNIRETINTPDVTISGDFSESEARNLALVLKYGSLPVQFTRSRAEDVSPTLGKDQLHAGLVAGVIGLALVALYMLVFYRVLGLVVWAGLLLTGMLFFSLLTWLSVHNGLTLTLAGVTGIIVSVGVTVDSYVVYFERLKDEVRQGKTVRSSLDPGFRKAFRTIIAADVVSLIGAGVLYALTSSSVKGFALFLGISTAIDLLLAFTFMHPAVVLMARRPSLVRMKGVGIAAGFDTPEVRA